MHGSFVSGFLSVSNSFLIVLDRLITYYNIITWYILIIGYKYKSPCKCIALQIYSTDVIDKMEMPV